MTNFIRMRKAPDCVSGFDLKKKLTIFCVLVSLSQVHAYTISFTGTKGLEKVQQQKTISGQINDENGLPLPGATVSIRDTKIGTITDFDGKFTLRLDANSKILVVSSVGYKTEELTIGNRSEFKLSLKSSSEGLNEVVVVGFGTQKKESVVSAITTIPVGEIKGPSSNLTTMMAGRVSGMIAYQRSGEPGSDNSDFFIRGLGSFGSGKVDPLILIDGVESSSTDMARLQPDDIEAFSVLKDASAASIYGARGANGVVLITTKSGKDGKLKVKFRQEYKMSSNTRNFKFADNITYMQLANEAVLTRNPIGVLPYSQTKIDRTAQPGSNEYLYPNNNWIDQLIKDYTINEGFNLSVSGGGEKAQYYIASTYNIDNGVLKVDDLNNFNSNIKLRNYSFRSNVNMRLTPTTEGIVRLYGQFDDYTGPLGGQDPNDPNKWVSGGGNIFNKAVWSNPVAFPASYPGELLPYVEHPLFGGAVTGIGSTALLTNPYAEMVKGYEVYKASTVQTQIELKQDLKMLTPGLKARAMAYVKRYSYYRVSRQYTPFYYSATINPDTDQISLNLLNGGGEGSLSPIGSEYLNYGESAKNLDSGIYLETAINYNRTFAEKHDISGMLINIMQSKESGNAGSLQASLPSRNFGLSGRFTYAYDSRYLAEVNFGYNGSERFAKNNRFGFFPSFAAGYVISNEKFFEPLLDIISNLKFRASFGWVGNDQIGKSTDRFFYLSNVNLNNGGYGASFGELNLYTRPGVSISRYANDQISWERSKQINIGMDLKLFNSIDIVVDAFKQTRSNILQTRSNIGSTLGLAVTPSTNFGEAESKGMDMSINYNKHFGDNWFVNFRANLTYSKSKILKYDENYYPPELDYLYKKGNSIAQTYGYIAERLFVDDQEAANSPKQFGTYGGGDIKYRDVNGDGVITALDRVPIGYPTSPEIIYGFGGTLGYKDFDFSLFFQGSARSSFFINPRNISPFVTNGGAQNGLLKVVADDHWSEENRDAYAFWPRLSNTFVTNNVSPPDEKGESSTSTWWMRNGNFLRLKNVEIGYNVPKSFIDKYHVTGLRLYVNTTNPVVFSQFKLWDPEMGGNGLGYPVQSTYNFGILLDL